MTRMNGPEQLTPRELEVALLIGNGLRNKEIGGALGIAEQTVKNHIQSALSKLGIHSRAALAVHADRQEALDRLNAVVRKSTGGSYRSSR